MKPHKVFSIASCCGSILATFALAGCQPTGQPTKTRNETGVVYLQGWAKAENSLSGGVNVDFNTDPAYCQSADINGEVGMAFGICSPRMTTYPAGADWNASTSLVSGKLPPGLRLDGLNIQGIPTEPGHWVIKLEVNNIRVLGKSIKPFQQELRIHITGSGKVH